MEIPSFIEYKVWKLGGEVSAVTVSLGVIRLIGNINEFTEEAKKEP